MNYMAMLNQLRSQFSDAVINEGTAFIVSFTHNGYACTAELGTHNVSVMFKLGGEYHVNGHVPYICRKLDMETFMKKMNELEKDAKAKVQMLRARSLLKA